MPLPKIVKLYQIMDKLRWKWVIAKGNRLEARRKYDEAAMNYYNERWKQMKWS